MPMPDIPDIDDEFIGYAILAIMFMFMFVWITSPVSPIHFPGQANVAQFVSRISVVLVVVIPFALLGLIESLFGSEVGKVHTPSSHAIENATNKLRAYRASHKRVKDNSPRYKHENV
jgi:hypothetical protein